MSNKIVQLNDIKVDGPRRKRKEIKAHLKSLIAMVDSHDVRGFTLVFFDSKGPVYANYNTGCLGAASNLRADLSKRALEHVQVNGQIGSYIEDMLDE